MNFDIEEDEALFELHVGQTDNVPLKYEDIKLQKDGEEWMNAMKEEVEVLKERNTWEVVPQSNNEKFVEDANFKNLTIRSCL
ncbi:hypothetical protein QE152_g1953 [Popillia japonica]|uniref:Uncharacterized protein n=1 Tax=Popillia japonica TaxID=7064 RepID=A0AAW1N7C9_POPJA